MTRPARSLLVLACLAVLAPAGARPLLAQPGTNRCPVTGDDFEITANTPRDQVNDTTVYFCCNDCVKSFRAEPEKYLLLAEKGKCPVQGHPARAEVMLRVVVNNRLHYLCCDSCTGEFGKTPARWFPTLTDPVTKQSFPVRADSPHVVYRGQHYFFASPKSRAEFERAPDTFVVIYGEKQPD